MRRSWFYHVSFPLSAQSQCHIWNRKFGRKSKLFPTHHWLCTLTKACRTTLKKTDAHLHEGARRKSYSPCMLLTSSLPLIVTRLLCLSATRLEERKHHRQLLFMIFLSWFLICNKKTLMILTGVDLFVISLYSFCGDVPQISNACREFPIYFY